MNILHGITGSVACTIANKFALTYREQGHYPEAMITPTIDKFDKYDGKELLNLVNFDWVHTDSDEWHDYHASREHGEKSVLHIELVKWADALVIAPCSANTLAKIANGICDNLLTCVARAWDFQKQFIIAPSMNTQMITHPIYQQHIKTMESWGIIVVPPQKKELFCGDYGLGGMANIDDIISRIESK